MVVFFCKQKTAYEMRISDWSSDVCSSDLDFNRKQTSTFSGMIGQRVAAPGVTVIDDGTLPDRRGSLTVDDEGTPTSRTVLIEDGILVGYMQDRQNARLMGMAPSGHGRRESYPHHPLPRLAKERKNPTQT